MHELAGLEAEAVCAMRGGLNGLRVRAGSDRLSDDNAKVVVRQAARFRPPAALLHEVVVGSLEWRGDRLRDPHVLERLPHRAAVAGPQAGHEGFVVARQSEDREWPVAEVVRHAGKRRSPCGR